MRAALVLVALVAAGFAVDSLGRAAEADPAGGASFARGAVGVLVLVVVAVIALGTWEGGRR